MLYQEESTALGGKPPPAQCFERNPQCQQKLDFSILEVLGKKDTLSMASFFILCSLLSFSVLSVYLFSKAYILQQSF